MKKLLLLLLGLMASVLPVLAFEATDFIVEVGSDTVKAGEPVDLTIKAVDDSGALVDDYDGEVLMIIDSLSDGEYELPQDGIYEFTEEDLGEKTFSKGFIIDKPGTYTLTVEDFLDEEIVGEVEVTVTGAGEEETQNFKLEIVSPTPGETIKTFSIDILGVSDHKSGKVYAYVDGQVAGEGVTEANGDYAIQISNVSNGTHSLQVKAVDIFDEEVGESDEINFVAEVNDNWFKSIEVKPSNVVDQGTTIDVTVNTVSQVTEAILEIPSMKEYPMEKQGGGVFTVSVFMETPGVFDLNLELISEGVSKNYEKAEKVTVIENKAIKNVRFVRNDNEKFINLDWEYEGQIDYFRVDYSTDKAEVEAGLDVETDDIDLEITEDGLDFETDGLDVDITEGGLDIDAGGLDVTIEDEEVTVQLNTKGSQITEVNKFVIENTAETKTYYVTIYPVDSDGAVVGDDSGLIVIEPGYQEAGGEEQIFCSVDNIELNVVGTEENSYLEWEAVDNVVTYIVYKGDDKDNLSEIAQLTGTTYDLPFDAEATEEIYEYFSVKAVCDDGTITQIDDIKKVKVGPMDWLIWAGILAMMSYGLFAAYRKEEN